jgi:hypothetical protein
MPIGTTYSTDGGKHAARDTARGPAAPRQPYHHVRAGPDGTILRVTSFPLHLDDRMKNPLVRSALAAIAGYIRRVYYANPIFGAVAAWLGARLDKGAAT